MTFFDVRIPGLKMTVVAADGQYVEPISIDEFRIGVAETYDVIVEPKDDRAYTIFAQGIWTTCTYADLRHLHTTSDPRDPEREIELHLTGNMSRYMWSINGVKFADAEPLVMKYGERLRITLVNDTMMNHPIHLHGLWSDLETGDNQHIPRKHTVIVQPGSKISYRVTVDAKGRWAYHCHLLYHMSGMFREVRLVCLKPAFADMEADPLLSKLMIDKLEISEADEGNPLAWEAELQLLYSRAISPYWDLQLGWRGDMQPTPTRNWAVISTIYWNKLVKTIYD
ncbi:multicopper oxidase domain-containing protein [Candidatus Marithrix sp. Canyon 246]|uniref:multicopper oxidase domain-containing protein n=1 Tax=Candidatus Marithrix sp. Canyon 246 TaxID=1827136 RepID=UPI00084A0F8E